jgi:hypothetical protein
MNEGLISSAIMFTYFLLGLTALVAIIGPMVQLVKNFKKAKAALIGIVVLAAVLLLGFSLSTNEVYEGFNVSPLASQWIGGGIKATMILIGMAAVAAVYTEVSKFFR